jgi:hypothetical protein
MIYLNQEILLQQLIQIYLQDILELLFLPIHLVHLLLFHPLVHHLDLINVHHLLYMLLYYYMYLYYLMLMMLKNHNKKIHHFHHHHHLNYIHQNPTMMIYLFVIEQIYQLIKIIHLNDNENIYDNHI